MLFGPVSAGRQNGHSTNRTELEQEDQVKISNTLMTWENFYNKQLTLKMRGGIFTIAWDFKVT
jgi:hypothetical protein